MDGNVKSTNKFERNIIFKSIDYISTFMGGIAGWGMVSVAIMMCYEIVVRWIGSPTIWVVEISGYSLIWFAFLSAAYGLKEGSHIQVDILISRLTPKIQNLLNIINFSLCLFYSLLIFYFSWDLMHYAFQVGERSSTMLKVPMGLLHLGVLIGSGLLAVQSIKELIKTVAQTSRYKGDIEIGIYTKPFFIIPIYLILIGISIWIYSHNPGLGLVLLLIISLLAGVPVFASLGLVGSLGLFFLLGGHFGLQQISMISVKSLDSFTLLAIPLYILGGQILMASGIGEDLFEVCSRWVGHLPGGAMIATIGACAVFAAISGSSVATAATIGIIAIPEMLKRNYDPSQSYGVLAAGGTLGILIPPSAAMIIYSSVTEESTGALFIGGIIPGIMLALFFAVFAVIRCSRSGMYEKTEPSSWLERFRSLKESVWGLLAPVIVIGGIYTGIFTPTEAAAVVVVYALAVLLFSRRVSLKQLHKVMSDGTRNSTMILLIVVGAMILGTIVTFLRVPQNLCDFVSTLHMSRWIILAILCVSYIFLGMFLEVVSILLITIPIVYPLIIQLGFNGLWFGVFVTILMEMAMITPPVGLNLYVIQGVASTKLEQVVKGAWPYMILMLALVLILAMFPNIVTWLPGTMGYQTSF